MLALALLAGCALRLDGSDLSARDRSLRIATWNLGSGADPRGAACQTLGAADIASLRREIEQLDADVIAFQDVESEAVARSLFDRSRYVVIMERRRRPVPVRCGRPGPPRNSMERTLGIAVRRNIPFSLHDLPALQSGDPSLPPGIEVGLRPRAGRPVRLLTIQLRPGCATDLTGDACVSLQRQADVLRRWIDGAARGPSRFLVLGGWNRPLAMTRDAFWAEIDAPDAGLTIANGAAQCALETEGSLDHIVLDRRAAAGLRPRADQPRGPVPRGFHHCPILIEIAR